MSDLTYDIEPSGVYYPADAYVGLGRRLAAGVIDIIVIMALFWGVSIPLSFLVQPTYAGNTALFYGIAWLYLTVLKASPIRTVGYRLLKAQVVTLDGTRPSVARMTFRLLISWVGPLAVPFDLLWCSSDDQKQALHDRYSGTCVVRSSAQPAGTARLRMAVHTACGLMLTYPMALPASHRASVAK